MGQSKGRWLQQISNLAVIFQTEDGRTGPTGYPGAGISLNNMSDEELALLDLQPYVAPVIVPDPPTLEEYQAQKLSQVRQEAAFHIEETYPPFYQRNVALGLYPEGTMTADIEAVIVESNRVEDAIDAAVTNDLVDVAYATLSWPVIGG